MTLTVMFLLIAELLQALACCIVYARSVMAEKSIKGLLLGKEAFTGIRMAINAKVGASVDAAAKNPETKNTVTSIYTNRRVTNGIAF